MALCLRDLSLDELTTVVHDLGSSTGRAKNLFRALHRYETKRADLLTGVARDLRTAIGGSGFVLSPLTLHQVSVSREDRGTKKYLFLTHDGLPVEAVLMPALDDRTTLCVSSQVGCRMGCAFCCTARMGFVRQLTTGEIVSQFTMVAHLQRTLGTSPLTNVVFMGMGEPFDNYDNVMKAFDILNHPLGPGISRDRITISTCGVVDGIDKLASRNIRTNLAVSLNAPDDTLRTKLMPINRKWPLVELVAALRRFPLRPGRVFYIEYVLFAGVNDTAEHAHELMRLLDGVPCKINVIRYNPVEGLPFGAPSRDAVSDFASLLENFSRGALVRRSRGGDITAACGQLGLAFLRKTAKLA